MYVWNLYLKLMFITKRRCQNKMDVDQQSSFMNLLSRDESQQQPRSNAPNHPPNWQYLKYPPPLNHQHYEPPYTPCY